MHIPLLQKKLHTNIFISDVIKCAQNLPCLEVQVEVLLMVYVLTKAVAVTVPPVKAKYYSIHM